MGTFEKLLEQMRRNPCNDWKMANLLTIAKRLNIEVRNSGGSHHVFSHSEIEEDLVVPYRRPIKVIYIKKFLALVDVVREVV